MRIAKAAIGSASADRERSPPARFQSNDSMESASHAATAAAGRWRSWTGSLLAISSSVRSSSSFSLADRHC